jgi:enoyl-CoA hydratase
VLDITGADGTQTWTMRFGRANAIDPEFLLGMESALEGAIADESISVVVITSGLRVFSAGADARWIGQVTREHGAPQLLTEFNRTMDRFRDLCLRMRRSDLLFIAALNGHTLADGLELAAFARRIAARAGRIGINAAKRSILDAVSLPVYEGLEVDRLVHWDSMRRSGVLPGVEAFVEQYG